MSFSAPSSENLAASAGADLHLPALPSFASECRQTIALALPLIVGQVGQMLMGVADTVMIGHLGVVPLGAATVANTITAVPYVLGIGLLSSVSVRVSQARGAERRDLAGEALRHGTAMALLFSTAVVLLILGALPFLHLLRQSPEVTAATPPYLFIITFSLIPAMLSMTWKNHADALNQPWPAFWILFGGVLLNVLLNWLWIWGHWGFPALGISGGAWATFAARAATAIAMLIWLMWSRRVREWCPTRWLGSWSKGTFASLLLIGFPASLQLLTEVGAFAAASLLIGTLGAVPLAAHQVAITCAATTFMLPLGVAMAMTVRVGEVIGSREPGRLRRVLLGGWLYAGGFMTVTMVVFLIAGHQIASSFIADPGVVQIAASLLIIAGFFQLFDGLQVVSAGALRGMNDVRVPAWIALASYWGLALPLGAALGIWWNWGAAGIWGGLAAGLALAAVALGVRVWRRFG